MQILDNVASEAIKWAVPAILGAIVIQLPNVKEWLSKNQLLQTLITSALSAIIIGLILIIGYDYYKKGSLHLQESADVSYGDDPTAFLTQNHEGPVQSTCGPGSYAVGIKWWGDGRAACSGCWAKGQVICRKLEVSEGPKEMK